MGGIPPVLLLLKQLSCHYRVLQGSSTLGTIIRLNRLSYEWEAERQSGRESRVPNTGPYTTLPSDVSGHEVTPSMLAICIEVDVRP